MKNGRDVVGILVSFRGFVVPCGMKHLVVIFKILCVTLSHVGFAVTGHKKKVSSDGFQGQTIALSDRYFCGVRQHMIKHVDLSRCSQHFSSIPSDITERRTTFPLNGRWLCNGHHPRCRRTLEHAELDTYHYSDETLS